jgi:release factor glutamine methyltransferase
VEEMIEMAQETLLKNQQIKDRHLISYQEKDFVVFPNVFSPEIFPSTFFFANNIPFKPQTSFLEIGSGVGLISVMAALSGIRKVVATDINPDAVENTIENAIRHKVHEKINVRMGDVFDPIQLNEKFDTIWWNIPFIHVERKELTLLEKSIFNPGYDSLTTYLSQAKKFLNVNGKVLIGFSPTLGRMEMLNSIAEKYGWSLKILSEYEEKLPQQPIVKIELFEASPVN